MWQALLQQQAPALRFKPETPSVEAGVLCLVHNTNSAVGVKTQAKKSAKVSVCLSTVTNSESGSLQTEYGAPF